jgi:hypothetical protein
MAQGGTSSAESRRSSGGSRRATGTSARTTRKTKASSRRTTNQSSRRKAGSSQPPSTSGAESANGARSALVKLAEKAKVPALAGGAALVGLAGGVALSNRRKGVFSGGSKLSALPNLAKRLPTPNGSAANLLGDAATEVAKGSSKVRDLASHVQKVAEAVSPESSSDGAD